jgi:AraC family transcriptional regulator of adaptative response / DNA-3-methyladenine glycosylase II
MKTKEDVYYEAMLARDPRFDGKFFIGVKTTGIYCRPICPAKPKRENVEFFSNHIEAEKAGYRPCLRCRPECAPQSPAWIGKSAMVQRAIKIINNQETINFNEDEFASKFGVSARHLRRVFVEEIGKTPKQLAFENRLNLSRRLISETQLPLTEVAFASGFSSIRRFNDAFKERFKKPPSSIRRLKTIDSEGISISLPYRPPYDFEGLLQSYKNHCVGNLEWFEPGKMTRVLSFENKIGLVSITHDPDNNRLLAKIHFPDTSYIHLILTRIRGLFDLDSDPVVVANSLESHPKMKTLLKKHPGIRLPSGWDSFEIGVATILGQLVSIEQGRRLVADLIEHLGEESSLTYEGKLIRLFPTPLAVATSDLKELKTTQNRKETLRSFARAIHQGEISLEPTQDIEDVEKKLKRIKGIGPWTAEYISLKAIRHTDSFPSTDLILGRALKSYSFESIHNMSPWRGYVAALLWKEYATKPEKKNEHNTI